MLYNIPHDPKMLHEAMTTAAYLLRTYGDLNSEPLAKIAADIAKECERLRPLGPNGKHGDLHTEWCGCDGPSWRGTVLENVLRDVVRGRLDSHPQATRERLKEYREFYKFRNSNVQTTPIRIVRKSS